MVLKGSKRSNTKRKREELKTSGKDEMDAKLIRSDVDPRQTSVLLTPPTTPPLYSNVLSNPGLLYNDVPYPMSSTERGVALIFSHKHFDARGYVDEVRRRTTRSVVQADRDALCEAFKRLNFEVSCFDDLDYHQIRNELRMVAQQDPSKLNCIAVVVLTHGERNGMLSARDKRYCVSELWKPFTPRLCPSLAGKPKIFFIQVYKGDDVEPSGMISNCAQDVPDCMTEETITYPVPSYADILVSYSTFEGLNTYSNRKDGSSYVQTLCSHLKTHGKSMDLMSLLVEVTHNLGPQMGDVVQAPCFTSTLRRRLCFC